MLHIPVTRFLATALAITLGVSGGALAAAGGNAFSVQGDLQADHEEANCSLRFSKYGKVWTLSLTPKGEYDPSANLFFSPKFGPAKTGEFPVKFDFRGAEATFGGSVTNGMDMYSSDTEGRVTISRFDDRVVGSFAIKSFDRKKKAAEASGKFDCPRGDALK